MDAASETRSKIVSIALRRVGKTLEQKVDGRVQLEEVEEGVRGGKVESIGCPAELGLDWALTGDASATSGLRPLLLMAPRTNIFSANHSLSLRSFSSGRRPDTQSGRQVEWFGLEGAGFAPRPSSDRAA
jgi:hypothetical protein